MAIDLVMYAGSHFTHGLSVAALASFLVAAQPSFCAPALAESPVVFAQTAASRSEAVQRHKAFNGKPCIALESYAKPQAINKSVYEHWVQATNSCGQRIELQVCYHGSSACITMNVPPWEGKSSVLGIYPIKDFQYDTKEKF